MIDVGQTIGNYRLTARLGEGGMGVVYLAEHPVIGKKVALKAIHPELSRNAEVVSRFVTEAKSVNQIGHEHIVDIADFGTTPGGEFYFIMEYLQGEAMSDRLKREGRLDATRAMVIGAQIADALDASHEHGIIHRDLKPENIFLLQRGGSKDFVKVLDFGLAKLTQSEEKVTHKTRAGSVMGTPYYMAPEQCEGKTEIDHRADIYSLGVLLFEMLTGKVPFGGDGYGEIIVKHITMPPPSVRSLVPELSPELDLILFRALAKDREQRFQTMAELRDALLDPNRYASAAPVVAVPDDLSGVARAASPMARSEMDISSKLGPAFGSGNGIVRHLGTAPSTFRQGMGEIIDDLTPKRKTSRALLFAALACVTGAVVAMATQSGHDARPAAPIAALPSRPVTVRVNFNSDPDGAMVSTGDGKTLGLTPLSIEVPYSDSAIEYVFKKQGYEAKTMYIVPNLPSPLFATMQAIEPPAAPAPVAHKPTPPPTFSRRAKPSTSSNGKAKPDEDEVLEPSYR
ncbi:MAG TPA: serine/threonine-protein kinase [Polyangia bacterium]|nr:serine/threonine-protein kinase [Polyangia bacterium]